MNQNALADRLKIIAKERGTTFNLIWKQLLLERFLARLANSPYRKKFIFKGGLLLAQYLEIYRETSDIDLSLFNLKNDAGKIEECIKAIISVIIEDGFSFTWDTIEELDQPHMEYVGFRIRLNAYFGKMKDKIQIDVGFGDRVNATESNFKLIEYRGKPIYAGNIMLLVYPVETIFAEKLETIVSKGSINSRMKDFHDIILMQRESNLLDFSLLKNTLSETFAHRKTTLPVVIEFDADAQQNMQRLWSNHLRGLGAAREELRLPDEFSRVVLEINHFLVLLQSDLKTT